MNEKESKKRFAWSIIKKDLERYPEFEGIEKINIYDCKDDQFRIYRGLVIWEIRTHSIIDGDTGEIINAIDVIEGIRIYLRFQFPIDCLEYIIHHEVSHIIKRVIYGKKDHEHDKLFMDIGESLIKGFENKQEILCRDCPYRAGELCKINEEYFKGQKLKKNEIENLKKEFPNIIGTEIEAFTSDYLEKKKTNNTIKKE